MVSGFQSEDRTDLDLISYGHFRHLAPAELGAVATSALESHRRSAMSSKDWGSYSLYKIHQKSSCRVSGDKEQLKTFKENILSFGRWRQPSLSTERSKWLSTVHENTMSSPWDAWRKVMLSWHSSSYRAMPGGHGWEMRCWAVNLGSSTTLWPSGSSDGQTTPAMLAVTECTKNTFLVITLKNTKSKECVDAQSVKHMLHSLRT